MMRELLTTPKEVAFIRKATAELLGNMSRKVNADVDERRERLQRTEQRIGGLVRFIAEGKLFPLSLFSLRLDSTDDETTKTRDSEESAGLPASRQSRGLAPSCSRVSCAGAIRALYTAISLEFERRIAA